MFQEQAAMLHSVKGRVEVIMRLCHRFIAKPELLPMSVKDKALSNICAMSKAIKAYKAFVFATSTLYQIKPKYLEADGSCAWNDWLDNSATFTSDWTAVLQKIPQVGDLITRKLAAEYGSLEDEYDEVSQNSYSRYRSCLAGNSNANSCLYTGGSSCNRERVDPCPWRCVQAYDLVQLHN